MNETDRHRALADRGRAAFDRSAPNVSRGEHPRQTRLEEQRRPPLRAPEIAAHLDLAERRRGSARLHAHRARWRSITPGEEGVQLRDDRGPLADGGSHSLHRAATHVTHGEDPVDPCLQWER